MDPDNSLLMDAIMNPEFASGGISVHLRRLDPFNTTEMYEDIDVINRDEFRALRTDLERFDYVFHNHGSFPKLGEDELMGKNDWKATLYKNEGNELFKRHLYTKALVTYCKAIAYSDSKQLLAALYANRSALLFQIGRYQECLNDIERAFANNYSGRNKKQLLERRQKAIRALKPTVPYHDKVPAFSDEQKNAKIECASNSVEMKKSKRYGRHVVAAKDIKLGEILSIEKAFVCDTNGEYHKLHCPHCLEFCFDLIPCDSCWKIMFCSETCKKAAYDSYHQYECTILPTKFVWQKPFCAALRAAFKAKNSLDNFDSLSNIEDGDEVYRSTRYKEVHNLSTNKSLTVDQLVKLTRQAVKMFVFVKMHTKFFDQFEDKLAAMDKFKVVLLRQVQIAHFNVSDVWEYLKGDPNDSAHRYAYGIYPFYSMFNHSCDQNVEVSFFGSTMVLRAILPIKKGAQCFVNYHRYCEIFDKDERRSRLENRYGFKCECRICLKNLPIFTSHQQIRQSGSILMAENPYLMIHLSREMLSHDPDQRNTAVESIAKIIDEKLINVEPNYNPQSLYMAYRTYARGFYESFGNKIDNRYVIADDKLYHIP